MTDMESHTSRMVASIAHLWRNRATVNEHQSIHSWFRSLAKLVCDHLAYQEGS